MDDFNDQTIIEDEEENLEPIHTAIDLSEADGDEEFDPEEMGLSDFEIPEDDSEVNF